jgi:hypothetical protein
MENKNIKIQTENLAVEAKELVAAPREAKGAFCDTFVYEPENIQEQTLGNLYIVGGISNKLANNSSYLVNLLASIVKKDYYANPKKNPFESLESALHKANMTLADFTESGNTSWIGNLDMVVAVWREKNLHFSLTGKIKVYLLRNNEITDIGQNLAKGEAKPHPFKTFANIASGSLEERDKIIFATSAIIQNFSPGTLKNIFSIETSEGALKKIEDFFQKEKIKDNLGMLALEIKKEVVLKEKIALPEIKIEQKQEIEEYKKEIIDKPKSAGDQIQKGGEKLTLENILGEHFEEKLEENLEEEISEKEYGKENEELEIKQSKPTFFEKLINKKEIASDKIFSLSDKFSGKFQNLSAKQGSKFKTIIKKFKESIFALIKSTKIKSAPAINLSFKKIVSVFKKIIKRFDKKIYDNKTNPKEPDVYETKEGDIPESRLRETCDEPVKEGCAMPSRFQKTGLPRFFQSFAITAKNKIFKSQYLQKIKLKWNSFPAYSRLLLSTSLVLIILFAGSVMLLSQKKTHEINLTRYSEILSEANQKEDEAEAAMIYQDEAKARKALKESQESLGQIIGSDYLQKEVKELEAKIQEQLKKIDHLVEISEPKIIYDFRNLKPEIETKGLFNLNNILFSYDSANNKIYKYDVAENVGLEVEADSNSLGRLQKGTALTDNRLAFYTDALSIAVFNPDKDELKKIDAALAKEISLENLKDISSYGANIYFLDSENNQIWKHSPILGGFSKAEPWIKPNEESDFSSAVSLAIDGAIYVLKQDGTVLKYLSGYKKEFAVLSETTQPIEQATKICTLPGYANLYILEPKNKRVLIFDKQGKIITQYFSENFGDLKDLAVLEKEKKIYLLNGTEIIEIEME